MPQAIQDSAGTSKEELLAQLDPLCGVINYRAMMPSGREFWGALAATDIPLDDLVARYTADQGPSALPVLRYTLLGVIDIRQADLSNTEKAALIGQHMNEAPLYDGMISNMACRLGLRRRNQTSRAHKDYIRTVELPLMKRFHAEGLALPAMVARLNWLRGEIGVTYALGKHNYVNRDGMHYQMYARLQAGKDTADLLSAPKVWQTHGITPHLMPRIPAIATNSRAPANYSKSIEAPMVLGLATAGMDGAEVIEQLNKARAAKGYRPITLPAEQLFGLEGLREFPTAAQALNKAFRKGQQVAVLARK